MWKFVLNTNCFKCSEIRNILKKTKVRMKEDKNMKNESERERENCLKLVSEKTAHYAVITCRVGWLD